MDYWASGSSQEFGRGRTTGNKLSLSLEPLVLNEPEKFGAGAKGVVEGPLTPPKTPPRGEEGYRSRTRSPSPSSSGSLTPRPRHERQKTLLASLVQLVSLTSESSSHLSSISSAYQKTAVTHRSLLKSCSDARASVLSCSNSAQETYRLAREQQRDDEDRFDALADEAVLRFSKDVLDKIKLGVFGSGVVCGEFEKRRVLYEMKGVLGVSEEEVEKQEGREMDEKWVALATDLAETIIERVPAVAPSLAEEQLTTITSTITSIVNPVVERLYHLRLVLSARVSLRVAEFEQGVEEAAARVAKHKSLVRKLEKSASRLGELKELERRARAEAEEWEDELGRVVLGLVLLR